IYNAPSHSPIQPTSNLLISYPTYRRHTIVPQWCQVVSEQVPTSPFGLPCWKFQPGTAELLAEQTRDSTSSMTIVANSLESCGNNKKSRRREDHRQHSEQDTRVAYRLLLTLEKMLAICGPSRTRDAITTTATRAMIKAYSSMPWPRARLNTRSKIQLSIQCLPLELCPTAGKHARQEIDESLWPPSNPQSPQYPRRGQI